MDTGEEYRKVLAKHNGFYNSLVRAVRNVKWQGFNIPVPKKEFEGFEDSPFNRPKNFWCTNVLERLGFPIYFSTKNDGVVFIDAYTVNYLSNKRIKEILKGNVVITSRCALKLIERGFNEFIGVNVEEYNEKNISYEKILSSGITRVQKNNLRLIPNKNAKVLSINYHLKNNVIEEELFPASVSFQNSLGGKVLCFSGTTEYGMHYTEGFGFLNSSRKKQFADEFESFLPVYYNGDAEVFCKYGTTKNGEGLLAILNIGLDPIENMNLIIKDKVNSIKMLMPNGKRKNCKFSADNRTLTVYNTIYPAMPVILFVK